MVSVPPGSTYRVQLHPDFGFHDAAAIAPYLRDLGITHIYCSPYLQAARGSTHGYDVVDPERLNEELGGDAGFAELVEAQRSLGLGQVLDIVPNHMAVVSHQNKWWWEVLEDGPSSRYAKFFDIDWSGPDEKAEATILVPVLGDHYGRVLEDGKIVVARQSASLVIRYGDLEMPVSPRTYDAILGPAAAAAGSDELKELSERFSALPHARRTSTAATAERYKQKRELADRLAELLAEDPGVAGAIDAEIAALNTDFDRLDGLVRRQNYRLAIWRAAVDELDYRRFFNIESLAGIRVEDEEVFERTHAKVLELVADGTVGGLRVDHVDGLRDPAGYLNRLRDRSGGAYTVVEKILATDEVLPGDWPVAGTSGYDFLIRTNNLFVCRANEASITDCYQEFTGEQASYGDVVYAAKHQVMADELASEVDRLLRILVPICDEHRRHRDRSRRELRDALTEMLAAFPVYRTYLQPPRPATEADEQKVALALRRAADRRPDIDAELLSFMADLLLLRYPGAAETEFAVRFAQVSAPVMAKGVEDTAFYRYNRLVSLNEVGGSPDVFGAGPEDFHAATARVAGAWPETMLTLSTHDTKRSADSRARINLLSELPEEWGGAIARFQEINASHRDGTWPDTNAEYLLYQSMVGTWPISADRLVAFMTKATREAKVHTSWTDPVPEYDQARDRFVTSACADPRFVAAMDDFLATNRIVERGRVNSLAQTALLLTCPGVPDVYQGSELWDLSLVDPDNRRPVDFGERRLLLHRVGDNTPAGNTDEDDAGASKLALVTKLLHHRRRCPQTYGSGGYEPLPISGAGAEHALAFGRPDLVVIVPRLVCQIPDRWPATIDLGPGTWTDVVTHESTRGGQVRLSNLMARFPVAVLARERA